MTSKTLQILLVEDSPTDALIVQEAMTEATRIKFVVTVAERLADALEQLNKQIFDIVLLDLNLPDSDGFQTFARLREAASAVPTIILSGTANEALAVKAVQAGAQDYLVKGQVSGQLLERAIQYAIERKRTVETQRLLHGQLRQLLDHSPAVLYAWKLDGEKFIPHLISENISALLGFKASEAMGHDWWRCQVHQDDQERAIANIKQTVTNGTSQTQYRFRHKDGSYRWVDDNRRVVLDAAGQPAELVGVWTDITESKQSQETLVQSEERFSSAFEYASIGMALVAPGGKFLKVNRSLCNLVGYSADELLSKRFQEITYLPDLERDTANVKEMISGVIPFYQMEKRYTHKQGHLVWTLLSVSLVRDAQGQPLHFISQIQDITERREAEAELEDTHRRLVETSRRAGMAEVATGVLHNVGNVLNSLNVSTSVVTASVKNSKVSSLVKVVTLLQEHERDLETYLTKDPQGKKLPSFFTDLSEHLLAERAATLKELESLRGNVEHIKEIITMQQKYARVSAIKELVNVRDLVEDSLRINTGSLERHKVELFREFEVVPLINIEKHLVMQILINLVRNAKHACDDSSSTDKKITVRVTKIDDRVRICVSDNGIGIPQENFARIFNHGFTTRKEGHGFGLFSSAQAAKQMHGSLTVHSDGLGQGAAFTLDLPCLTNEEAHE